MRAAKMRVFAGTALISSVAGMLTAGAAAHQSVGRPIPVARQGKADPAKLNTPNGGRPEIHSREEMAQVSGYTAPGARAYAGLAADAGGALWPVTLAYRCRNTPGGSSIHAAQPQPIEVFDGVYSVGDDANNIWALNTREGIILLDALTTEADAKQVIVANMRRVGLDPALIRIIVITHNHRDHYGGAAYLKSISGARLAMSEADWSAKLPDLPAKGPIDFYLTDGQEITLGERTVSVYLTPGHTPGTASLVFPVTDKGVPHTAALFGGQGSPKNVSALTAFRHSLDHFADATDRAQADVILSNHTVGDDGLTRVAALAKRKTGEPNPYVVGRDGVIRYDALWHACLSADIDQRIWDARHGTGPRRDETPRTIATGSGGAERD